MNDNDPPSPAEAALTRFHEERFPDRASAQRTVVRQQIQLRSKRGHVRLLLSAYATIQAWFKPVTLAIMFFAASAFLLSLSANGFNQTTVPFAMAVLLLAVLFSLENLIGKPVHRGRSWDMRKGWHFELSPNFKRMYRASYRETQNRRRTGMR